MFRDRDYPQMIFYGVQVVIRVSEKDNLPRRLHRLISEGAVEENSAQKLAFYERAAWLLIEYQPSFTYGYWDYITDPDDAQAEFQQWVHEIESSISTDEEQPGDQSNESDHLSSNHSFVVVTMAFLLEGSPTLEQFMSAVEEIPEDEYFSRATFRKLIST
ncbi:MAG: hypothetical protein HY731_09590, partial [Candidatus Tectomicrobia bacterium]|nr:hypothetical protein [Candidatus Tectomicrobia bacterium]